MGHKKFAEHIEHLVRRLRPLGRQAASSARASEALGQTLAELASALGGLRVSDVNRKVLDGVQALVRQCQEVVASLAAGGTGPPLPLEAFREILYVVDAAGTFTYVSSQVTRYGFRPEDLVARPFLDFVHPEDRERVRRDFEKTLSTGEEFPTVARALDAQGRVRWFEERGHVQRDASGAIVGIAGILRDVTDREEAAQRLRESEQRYRTLVESAGEAIWTLDEGGTFAFLNSTAARRLGGKPADLVGKTLRDVFPAEVAERYAAAGRRAIQTGRGELFDSVEDHQGQRRLYRVTASPLKDAAGKPTAALIIARDLTERESAEEALRESEERLEDVLRVVRDVVWEATADGRQYLYLNQAAEEIYGRPRTEFLANPNLWFEAIHPDDQPRAAEATQRLLEEGRVDLEYRILRPDGEVRWVRDRKAVVRDEAGGAVRIGGLVTDITERKRMEEKARQYQERLRSLTLELVVAEERERRRLAADLHDDLTQTLSLAGVRLAELRRAAGAPAVDDGLKELGALLGQAEAAARSLVFQLCPPPLYDLGFVPAAEWLAEEMRRRYGLEVAFEDDGRPKPMEERVRVTLFRCLREALINVAKHARTNRSKVTVRSEGRHVVVTVEDRGRGFDAAALRDRHTGRGFGLFSAYEQLEHLGGRMEVRSVPGDGTRVTMTVPLAAEAEERTE